MSNNIMLGWPNLIGQATLSGGTWASAPFARANMQLTEVTKVARTTGITTGATQFQMDFGTAKRIAVLAEINCNAPEGTLRRVSAGTTAGASDVYAGDWHDYHGITYSEDGIEFLAPEWWGDDLDSNVYSNPYIGVFPLGRDVTARHWKVEYDLSASTNSYLQIGRFFIGPAYQPQYNAVYGLVEGMIDYSTKQRLESGGMVDYARRAARTVQFEFPLTIAGAEEYRIREMLRRQRTTGDILYVPYPGDPDKRQIKGFLGRLDELSGMNSIGYLRRSIGLKLTEKL
jgi:hypothetical protein